MTGKKPSSDDLTGRRRRALFRAWHRGTREMDLILGPFADARIGTMSDKEMEQFEALMEVSDGELYGWLSGSAAVAPEHDNGVFRALGGFHDQSSKRVI